ncbi:MAG: Type 1 glutamine amidotransferase-like domain-containing protein [Pseudomonadota bacterium]
MAQVTLLGPQEPDSNIQDALTDVPADAPVVSITAGWREREGEIDALARAVERPLTDLRLYTRANSVFAADEALHAAISERQERLKEQQRLYRMRLQHLASSAYEMLGADSTSSEALHVEQRAAISQMRTLDRHHLRRVTQLQARFDQHWTPWERPALRAQLEAVEDIVKSAAAILIAGGHIAVLLNRLRLFGVDSLLRGRRIIAWSAGAMALCQHVVLYHDYAPEGRRKPEVLGNGLGLVSGIVPLSAAAQRLERDDRLWLSLYARRFSPAKCVALSSGALLHYEDGRLLRATDATRISLQGRMKLVRP